MKGAELLRAAAIAQAAGDVAAAVLADRAAAQIPDAPAVILSDAGHMVHVDQPERWLQALATFLND